jgi:hypothetical protein
MGHASMHGDPLAPAGHGIDAAPQREEADEERPSELHLRLGVALRHGCTTFQCALPMEDARADVARQQWGGGNPALPSNSVCPPGPRNLVNRRVSPHQRVGVLAPPGIVTVASGGAPPPQPPEALFVPTPADFAAKDRRLGQGGAAAAVTQTPQSSPGGCDHRRGRKQGRGEPPTSCYRTKTLRS